MPERILANMIRITIIYSSDQAISIWHTWICEEQELGACQGLKDGKFEEVGLHALNACCRNIRDGIMKARSFTRAVGGGS